MNLHTVVFYIPLRSALPQCSVFSLCFNFKGFLTSGRIYYVPSRWKGKKKKPVYYNTSKRIINLSHVRNKTKIYGILTVKRFGQMNQIFELQVLTIC